MQLTSTNQNLEFLQVANVFDSGINLYLKHLPLNAVLLKTFIGQDNFVLLNPNFV